MWSLHDDDLPPGAAERLADDPFGEGEAFDAAWELEALLDDRAREGLVDATELRRLVGELDLAHDRLADGDSSAVAFVQSVIGRIEALVAEGRLGVEDSDELIALAHAAIDTVEALPDHPE